jgi:hypothetical protein
MGAIDDLLAILANPDGPEIPERLESAWDRAVEEGLLTPNGRYFTDAGRTRLAKARHVNGRTRT